MMKSSMYQASDPVSQIPPAYGAFDLNRETPAIQTGHNGGFFGQPNTQPRSPSTNQRDEADNDYYKLDEHVKIDFNEIFRETDNAATFYPIRVAYSSLFDYTLSISYKVLTTITGWPVLIWWGLWFALFNWFIVFFAHPFIKMMFMITRIMAMPYRAFVRAFVDPCCQSVGQSLAYMRGNFRAHATIDGWGPNGATEI